MSTHKQLSASQAKGVRRHMKRQPKRDNRTKGHLVLRDANTGTILARAQVTGVPRPMKGGIRKMTNPLKRPTVQDMEQVLGLNRIEPMHVSPGMRETMDDDSAELKKWYEEELREVYAAYERE